MDKNLAKQKLREIPAVDEILGKLENEEINIPKALLMQTIRKSLSEIRESILKGAITKNIRSGTFDKISWKIKSLSKPSLQKVINGTGIVLHTGLGRAPISRIIWEKIQPTLTGYSNLEFDLKTGKRGERSHHVEKLINALTGAESSVAVNNNAAAVLLMLNTLADGKEVIISRGQEVEIGGSFRIPDVIQKSGCITVEIGTTNKTHLHDYVNAISANTGAILFTHTSNFRIKGFTKEVKINELVELSNQKQIPLIVDLGSGAVVDLEFFGLPHEPPVNSFIKTGAHIVSFSGDKLLGGPQAGIICGEKSLIEKIHKNSLYRALRCDKTILALLEASLLTYRSSRDFKESNLSLQLLTRNREQLFDLGNKILQLIPAGINDKHGLNLQKSTVQAGSGSLPTEKIPSVFIEFSKTSYKPDHLAKRFREASIPVLGYVHGNRFRIDLKAILPDQENQLAKIINEVLS